MQRCLAGKLIGIAHTDQRRAGNDLGETNSASSYTLVLMRLIAAALPLVSTLPAMAQDVQDTFVKHLKTSREFTLKVAEAMPEASYGFKLTDPQMSFAEQMIHIAQAGFFPQLSGGREDERRQARF